jgi:hypothetical protein
MNDGGEKRQAPPSGPYIDAFQCGRTGSSTYGAGAGSQTVGQHDSRSRQSGAISPPPLKRKRTSSGYCDSDTDVPGSIDWGRNVLTGPSSLRHRYASR